MEFLLYSIQCLFIFYIAVNVFFKLYQQFLLKFENLLLFHYEK